MFGISGGKNLTYLGFLEAAPSVFGGSEGRTPLFGIFGGRTPLVWDLWGQRALLFRISGFLISMHDSKCRLTM